MCKVYLGLSVFSCVVVAYLCVSCVVVAYLCVSGVVVA